MPSLVDGSLLHDADLASYRQGTAGVLHAFKILILDDSSSIRNLLRFFIPHNTGWQVCGEAENGQIAVEKNQGT